MKSKLIKIPTWSEIIKGNDVAIKCVNYSIGISKPFSTDIGCILLAEQETEKIFVHNRFDYLKGNYYLSLKTMFEIISKGVKYGK